MNSLIRVSAFLGIMCMASSAHAVVTYANCPTLAPLPVTNFMPAAMLPIQNAENMFDIGMNQVVRNAVTVATQIQIQAINSSFNSIMENMIKTSQTIQQNKIEIERRYQEMEMAYEADLASRNEQTTKMLFPGDPSMMRPRIGEDRVIDSASPSYSFIRQMCSAGKMQQMMTSKKVVSKAIENKSRRSQRLVANIQAVSSVEVKAKESIDRHYDMFCSETDLNNGLCDQTSLAPNADLDAFVFMYPTGSPAEADAEYRTIYTYSPVESLAAYQYIKHLTGALHITPPTSQESKDPRKVRYAAAYDQLISAMSVSADAMLSIAQNREPMNSQGRIVSELDGLNSLIEKAKLPESRRVLKSASETGRLVEMQRQMAIQQRIRLMILKQKEILRDMSATRVALENTVNQPN